MKPLPLLKPESATGFLSSLKTEICLHEFLAELFQLAASCAQTSNREQQKVKFSLPKRSEYCSRKRGTHRGNNDSLEMETSWPLLCK